MKFYNIDRSLNDINPSFPSDTRRHGRFVFTQFVYRNNLYFITYILGRHSFSNEKIFHPAKSVFFFFTSIILLSFSALSRVYY